MGRQYRQFKAIEIAARLLPRRVMYWVGDRVARLYYEKDERARNAVAGNLLRIRAFKGCEPRASEIDSLALLVFRGLARNFIDFFHFRRLSPHAYRRLFTVDGLRHLDAAHALGRGVIVTSGHFGAFEMAVFVVIARGYRVSEIVRPWEDPRANALFARQRARRGVDVIHLGNAAAGSLKALRDGRIVAILGDIDYTQRDDRTVFMGAEARLPLGPARLSVKTGAPLVPFFVSRLPDHRYAVRFCPPKVSTPGTGLEVVRTYVVRVLEEAIRENPHLWILFFDFWDCKLSLDLARNGFAIFERSGKKRDLMAV
jgi:KDO2-lipid IV(A) lauroyltransferase